MKDLKELSNKYYELVADLERIRRKAHIKKMEIRAVLLEIKKS